jgi:hypothetical protein
MLPLLLDLPSTMHRKRAAMPRAASQLRNYAPGFVALKHEARINRGHNRKPQLSITTTHYLSANPFARLHSTLTVRTNRNRPHSIEGEIVHERYH